MEGEMTFFGKKPKQGTKLLVLGIATFLGSMTLAGSDLVFVTGSGLTLSILASAQLIALTLCLVGMTLNTMQTVQRNKWLNAVGMTGIVASLTVALLYGLFPLLEILVFGGTGSMMYEKLGWHFDTIFILPLALFVLFLCVQVLTRSVQLLTGETKYQR